MARAAGPGDALGAGPDPLRADAGPRSFFVMIEGHAYGLSRCAVEPDSLLVRVGHLFGDVSDGVAGLQRSVARPSTHRSLAPGRYCSIIPAPPPRARESRGRSRMARERLAGRLYESREWIADIALKKVSARLASFLIRLVSETGGDGGPRVRRDKPRYTLRGAVGRRPDR